MSTTVYILKLACGKYYVGKSENFQKRMEDHLAGRGSAWTRKYKVEKVEKVIENASTFDEDKYVKEYMAKYGIDRVRGGSYVSETLDNVQVEAIERELRGASDCCTKCGYHGHFAKDCYAKKTWTSNNSGCVRCGRQGHTERNCYARSTVDGESLDSEDEWESDDEDEDDEEEDDDDYY